MGEVLVFALAAALNPTLLTATTVMLLLPNPKRLLLGYLLGALMTSITLGLVIIYELLDSGAVTTQKTHPEPVDRSGPRRHPAGTGVRPGHGSPGATGRAAEGEEGREGVVRTTAVAAVPGARLGPHHVRDRGTADASGRVLHRRADANPRPELRGAPDGRHRDRLQPDHAGPSRGARSSATQSPPNGRRMRSTGRRRRSAVTGGDSPPCSWRRWALPWWLAASWA